MHPGSGIYIQCVSYPNTNLYNYYTQGYNFISLLSLIVKLNFILWHAVSLCSCANYQKNNTVFHDDKNKTNKGNAKHGVSPRLKIRPWPWPWKSIRFQILLRSKYVHVPSLVKIHRRMLILECSQGCYVVKIWPLDLWPWKSIGFQTLLRTVCTKSGQNPLKDVDSRVFTRMLCSKNLTLWHWPLTYDLENQ